MKVASLETLYCDAGWRPWIFLKATTDDGLVGWAEITDSHGSPRGLAGIVEDLAPLVVGRDPRPHEAIYWDLYRATRPIGDGNGLGLSIVRRIVDRLGGTIRLTNIVEANRTGLRVLVTLPAVDPIPT